MGWFCTTRALESERAGIKPVSPGLESFEPGFLRMTATVLVGGRQGETAHRCETAARTEGCLGLRGGSGGFGGYRSRGTVPSRGHCHTIRKHCLMSVCEHDPVKNV